MSIRRHVIIYVILFTVLGLSACAPKDSEPAPTDGPIPIEPEVLPLITQPAPATVFEEALLIGNLTYEDNGCWRISNEGTSFLIVWPHGFTATGMIGAPQVLDTKGEVVGTAGMEISLGGGAREGEAATAFEDENPDLPLDQCPGPYWLVGEVAK